MLDSTDYECPLCLKLLVRPTTTPCGHSFCSRCLGRALETRYSCPLCRCEFDGYPHFSPNVLLGSLIEKYFPEEAFERQQEQEQEEREDRALRDIYFISRQMAVHLSARPLQGGSHEWTMALQMLSKSMCPYAPGAPIPVGFYVDHVVVFLGPGYSPDRVVLFDPDFQLTQTAETESELVLDVYFQPRFQQAPLRIRQPLTFAEPTSQVLTLQFDSRLIHS